MDKLPDIKRDFSGWYNTVIYQAGLVDEGPSRGSMVIRPYGYSIWEKIQHIVDAKIKKHGVQNAYFPLFIPEAFLNKEAKHIEGFSPELAVVTHAGGKKLEEPLVVRPTSETLIYHMFARWIKSWRDLPLKLNQWANVVRWEMRTRPFLRTTEFLWQEGHTAHHSYQEARELALAILAEYKDLAENYLAIPVLMGEKSANERFAGADHTFTFEAMMQDGKALQMGTSHVLAQSFPAAFDVKFQDKDGELRSPYCTSWGITTRLIGALTMVHGDQNGLIIPPRVAPITAVVIPIYKKDDDREAVLSSVKQVKERLEKVGISIHVDDDEQTSPGAKFYHWELKGVPMRIEIGARDVASEQVVVVNRAELDKAKRKVMVKLSDLESGVKNLCDEIHSMLFTRAQNYIKQQWHHGDKLTDFGPHLEQNNGFYQTGWCGSAQCEEPLKQNYKGTIRCIIPENKHSVCFVCGKPSVHEIVTAKAY